MSSSLFTESAPKISKITRSVQSSTAEPQKPTGAPWENGPYRIVDWWDMEQFSAAGFYSIACQLSIMAENADYDRQNNVPLMMGDEQRAIFLKCLNIIASDCENLRLRVSLYAAQSAIGEFKTAKYFGDLGRGVDHLSKTIEWEMRTRLFLSLTDEEASIYNKWSEGWEAIIERFGGVVCDVEEMQKCYALGRYTASIFHSLQVVEVGIVALGDYLEVNDPKRGWDATCKKLKILVDGGHSKLPEGFSGQYGFLEQINQCAQSMKHAWRNKVNHVDGRLAVLRSDFTPDIAEEVIMASRGFMRRLATELPK